MAVREALLPSVPPQGRHSVKKEYRFTNPFPFLLIPILDNFFRNTYLDGLDRKSWQEPRRPRLISGTLKIETLMFGSLEFKLEGRTPGRSDPSKTEKISVTGRIYPDFNGYRPTGKWWVVWGADTHEFTFS
mgnify:CR=1